MTIRHDRSDSQYLALATNSFPQGGRIGDDWIGSGTLISPNWVLTAGHVSSGWADHLAGGAVKVYDSTTAALLNGNFLSDSPVQPEGLAFGPDQNNDGIRDLYVTAWGAGGGLPGAGVVKVYRCDTGLFIADYVTGLYKPTDLWFAAESSPPPTPGDFNEDGAVDGIDLGIWATHYGTATGMTSRDGDGDGDGDVDGGDFLIWQRGFGPAVAAVAVPEPGATTLLVTLALLGLMLRRHRAGRIVLPHESACLGFREWGYPLDSRNHKM